MSRIHTIISDAASAAAELARQGNLGDDSFDDLTNNLRLATDFAEAIKVYGEEETERALDLWIASHHRGLDEDEFQTLSSGPFGDYTHPEDEYGPELPQTLLDLFPPVED